MWCLLAKDYLIPCFLWGLKFYKQKTMNYCMTIEILKVEAVWFGWLFIYLIFIFFLWNLRHVPLRDFAIYWCRCRCRLACVQTSDFIPEGGETSVHWVEVDVHIKKRQSTCDLYVLLVIAIAKCQRAKILRL